MFGSFSFGALAVKYLAIGGMVISVLGGIYIKGRTDAVNTFRAAALVEKTRQVEINKTVLDKTEKEANRLALENDKLQKEMDELNGEASKSPNADRNGLDADSVRRLNRVR